MSTETQRKESLIQFAHAIIVQCVLARNSSLLHTLILNRERGRGTLLFHFSFQFFHDLE